MTATRETPNQKIGESTGHCHDCGTEYIRTTDDRFSALCPDCADADSRARADAGEPFAIASWEAE